MDIAQVRACGVVERRAADFFEQLPDHHCDPEQLGWMLDVALGCLVRRWHRDLTRSRRRLRPKRGVFVGRHASDSSSRSSDPAEEQIAEKSQGTFRQSMGTPGTGHAKWPVRTMLCVVIGPEECER